MQACEAAQPAGKCNAVLHRCLLRHASRGLCEEEKGTPAAYRSSYACKARTLKIAENYSPFTRPLRRARSVFVGRFRPGGVDLDVSDPARVSLKQGENLMARRAIASRPRRPLISASCLPCCRLAAPLIFASSLLPFPAEAGS